MDSGYQHKLLAQEAMTSEAVDYPKHYLQHPSGIECIEVTEHMNFCLGNAIKYIWRASYKGGVEDLQKAVWYINREIMRLEEQNGQPTKYTQ